MPEAAALLDFYKNYNDFRAPADVVYKNAQQNLQHLLNTYHLPITNRILDYGAGRGLFADTCRQSGYKNSYSFDQYSDNAKFSLTFEQLVNAPWDVITMWGVLEHLTDPLTELARVLTKLRSGGLFAATTVHIEGQIPYRYKPPEHTLYFSQASIAALANRLELEILEYTPYRMIQRSDVYMSILTRTMPPEYRDKVKWDLPEYVNVPTNEIFIVLKKH